MAVADRFGRVEIPGKVTPPQNWHITLRFLGTIDDPTYDRFLGSMDADHLGRSFRIGLGGLGAFPNLRRATVLWSDINRGAGELGELAGVAEESAQSAGLSPEDRPFRAHLSLSRIRPPENVTRLVESTPDLDLSWRCDSVVVYESVLERGHPHYEPLETFRLVR